MPTLTVRSATIASILVSLAPLVGCGGSEEDEVREVLRGYLVDLYEEEDFAGVCDRLAPAAQRDLVSGWRAQRQMRSAADCEEVIVRLQEHGSLDAIAAAAFDPDPPRSGPPSLADLPVEEIEVDGDRATARIGQASVRTRLRRIDGEWKIARMELPPG